MESVVLWEVTQKLCETMVPAPVVMKKIEIQKKFQRRGGGELFPNGSEKTSVTYAKLPLIFGMGQPTDTVFVQENYREDRIVEGHHYGL